MFLTFLPFLLLWPISRNGTIGFCGPRRVQWTLWCPYLFWYLIGFHGKLFTGHQFCPTWQRWSSEKASQKLAFWFLQKCVCHSQSKSNRKDVHNFHVSKPDLLCELDTPCRGSTTNLCRLTTGGCGNIINFWCVCLSNSCVLLYRGGSQDRNKDLHPSWPIDHLNWWESHQPESVSVSKVSVCLMWTLHSAQYEQH